MSRRYTHINTDKIKTEIDRINKINKILGTRP